MEFNSINIKISSFKGENIIIFSSLALFTAISTILIFFGLDLIIDNFNLLIEEDFLLIKCNNDQINNEMVYSHMKQETGYNRKTSIFDPVIDLFSKSNSTYRYSPSYFQVFDLGKYKNSILLENNKLGCHLVPIKEALTYNQYLILECHNEYLNDVLNDLYRIILDYKQDNSL
jgi:hypothetical protein